MKTLLLGAVGAVALAGFVSSANAQTPCWSSAYGYYNCAAPQTMYYGSSVPQAYYAPTPYVAPTPYAAWNAYDYRDYRNDPRWLPSYPGPRTSSGWGW